LDYFSYIGASHAMPLLGFGIITFFTYFEVCVTSFDGMLVRYCIGDCVGTLLWHVWMKRGLSWLKEDSCMFQGMEFYFGYLTVDHWGWLGRVSPSCMVLFHYFDDFFVLETNVSTLRKLLIVDMHTLRSFFYHIHTWVCLEVNIASWSHFIPHIVDTSLSWGDISLGWLYLWLDHFIFYCC
jgi:hypothetical protein